MNNRPMVYYNHQARKWYASSNGFPYRSLFQKNRPIYPKSHVEDSRRDRSVMIANSLNMRSIANRTRRYIERRRK